MTTVSFYFVQTALLQCLLGIHRFRIEKVNLLRVLFLFSSVFIGVCVCVCVRSNGDTDYMVCLHSLLSNISAYQ